MKKPQLQKLRFFWWVLGGGQVRRCQVPSYLSPSYLAPYCPSCYDRTMNERIHYLSHTITHDESGAQVLTLLYQCLRLTTKKIRSVKHDERGILLDGQRVTVRQRVSEGQLLQVMLNDSLEKHDHILPNPMELSVLYEDDDLIFIDKPSGIVSHPSQGHLTDSIANGVMAYLQEKGERSGVHLIGRLDKGTSGVLGIAKNGVTKERMIEARANGNVEKTYFALVWGHFKEKQGTIQILMEEYRDPDDGNKLKMKGATTKEKALLAVTHYQVLKEYDSYSLVSCVLDSGRMHQIRFHMSAIGHPLLGDTMYGEADGVSRLMLHAGAVRFTHPYTGEEIQVISDYEKQL